MEKAPGEGVVLVDPNATAEVTAGGLEPEGLLASNGMHEKDAEDVSFIGEGGVAFRLGPEDDCGRGRYDESAIGTGLVEVVILGKRCKLVRGDSRYPSSSIPPQGGRGW